jgi:hypothetical protein
LEFSTPVEILDRQVHDPIAQGQCRTIATMLGEFQLRVSTTHAQKRSLRPGRKIRTSCLCQSPTRTRRLNHSSDLQHFLFSLIEGDLIVAVLITTLF